MAWQRIIALALLALAIPLLIRHSQLGPELPEEAAWKNGVSPPYDDPDLRAKTMRRAGFRRCWEFYRDEVAAQRLTLHEAAQHIYAFCEHNYPDFLRFLPYSGQQGTALEQIAALISLEIEDVYPREPFRSPSEPPPQPGT